MQCTVPPATLSDNIFPGAVECLAKETHHFGVHVHLLVIGQFRTSILDSHKKKAELDPERGEKCYAAIKEEMARRHTVTAGAQPGNPALAVQRIVDLARGEYSSADGTSKELPLRIPIGSDAVKVMKAKCETTLQSLGEWEAFAQSTDFEDKSPVPSYFR